jgi:ligand-binding SRPBCC domain-containing protein
MGKRKGFPPGFGIEFVRLGRRSYKLTASQVLPIPPEDAFGFFEDPRNLAAITPGWLDFRMLPSKGEAEVFEGAEFRYTIRWLGFRQRWRSRISDYSPPYRFTDIQVSGPYAHWSHLHVFERLPEGTLLRDEVTYRLPYGWLGGLLHRLLIRRQLEEIFRYRAVKIAGWARG